MSSTELQLIIAIVTVLGSGVSVYVGVKVALAEMRGDLKRHDELFELQGQKIDEATSRIVRLENQFFAK